MINMPIVSVLMTSYNREKYISEAIESVINQTYEHWELIILDDCSSDNTLGIALKYANRNTKIRVLQNEVNLGQFENRNKVVEYASGEILFYVDSDDTIDPITLSHITNLFSRFPNANYLTLNRDSYYRDEMEVNSSEFIRRNFFSYSNLHFGPGATAIKRLFFLQINGFPTIYGPANDMFYNLKAASCSSIILCKLEFLNYRRHEAQAINDRIGYLSNGYLYFRDAMLTLSVPLSKNEKEFFLIKNKRRFITNSINTIIITKNVFEIIECWKNVNFRFVDFFEGITNIRITHSSIQ